jgi:hypothetical protein
MCSEKHTDTTNEKHSVVQYILIFTYTQALAYLRMSRALSLSRFLHMLTYSDVC